MTNDFLKNYNKDSNKDNETQKKESNNSFYVEKTSFKSPQKNTSNDETKSTTQNDKKKLPIIPIAIGVGILILLIILLFIFNGGTKAEDMTGWDKSRVQLWAEENDVLLEIDDEFSDEIAPNIVISQNPLAGDTIKKGAFLEVAISKGADPSVKVKLPDFYKMSKSQAETWAKENHMTKLRITTEESKTITIGKLINFSINDNSVIGQEVRRDSPIYLVYSNGNGISGKVTVPDFKTMTLQEATDFARENNFILEIIHRFDTSIPKDGIISQSVEPNKVINTSDSIELIVSKGKEIYMPNFYNYKKDVAVALASKEGISYIIESKYSSLPKDQLISQSISSGTLYDSDEILILTYSLGETVFLPSFIDSDIAEVRKWVEEYNNQGCKLTINTTSTVSDKPQYTVLKQSHLNIYVDTTFVINIVVSDGKVIYMPDFDMQGTKYNDIMTRDKAISICTEFGLTAVFEPKENPSRLPGEIWDQSVVAGKEILQNNTIYLYYAPTGETTTVPDLAGMNVNDAMNTYGNDFYFTFNGVEPNGSETITNQSVFPNSTVPRGATINLS